MPPTSGPSIRPRPDRQNISELAIELVPDSRKDYYRHEAERYRVEKAEALKEAEQLEHESKEWDERSEHEIHEHHRWQQATTALSISIAMAAIALLSREPARCSSASTGSPRWDSRSACSAAIHI